MHPKAAEPALKIILFLAVLTFSRAVADPRLPTIPSGTVDISKSGVIADSSTDNAPAIQRVVDSVADAGGGTIIFPSSAKPYISSPFKLASRINLRIEAGARLQMMSYKKYPLSGSAYSNWITATNDTDIEISGKGIIEGNGEDWWAAFKANKNMPHRPYMIRIIGCERVLVHGVILTNSPSFHLVITADNATIDSILILAPSTSPNTDGIDPAGTNYLITGDSIAVGDDNIAIKPGNALCKNIVITNCRFGVGHGLSIGGQTNYGLDSLLVDHCSFTGTTSGLRLKASRIAGGLVRHLSYSNITMTDVQHPLYFDSYYSDTTADPFTDTAHPITATTPYWKDITVRNLTAIGTQYSVQFEGTPEAPIDSVFLSNVAITAKTGFMLAHAYNIQLQGVTLNGSSSNMIKQKVDATIETIPILGVGDKRSATIAVPGVKSQSVRYVNITGRIIPSNGISANDGYLLNAGERLGRIIIKGVR